MKCPVCGKTDVESQSIMGSVVAHVCADCERRRMESEKKHRAEVRVENHIDDGYVTPAARQAWFCNWDETTHARLPVIENWLYGKARTLFLWGSHNAGKTFSARCVLTQACAEGLTVGETLVSRCVKEMRQFGKIDGKTLEISKRRVILLDELDKVEPDNMNMIALFELINTRYDNGARTIFTSNLNKEQIYRLFVQSACGNKSVVSGMFDRFNPCDTVEINARKSRKDN